MNISSTSTTRRLHDLPGIRLLKRPYRWLKNYYTPEAVNVRKLRALRDRHRGRRGVVLGNGPSLRVEDLGRLGGDVTFASNKIFLAFPETSWRPTYYSVSDILVAQNNLEEINTLRLAKIFGSSVKEVFPDRTDILWLRERNAPEQSFSEDCAECVYGGFSVVYYQLQLAFHMGIREVYLIGMDFSFAVPTGTGQMSIHGEVIKSEGEVNHFHRDYRKPGETWTMPRLDKQQEAFACAKAAFERHGGVVYNASRSTKLEVFPKVSFDTIFPGP
ncbi:hypothetical protein P12x_006051 (plasmid) [Tundrisphaera lichenicola]|uniref:hypothetical protein n=1 Tax=Tundrisphaera lichenicola TaxID=2029860 RepID=UPI003EBCA2C8